MHKSPLVRYYRPTLFQFSSTNQNSLKSDCTARITVIRCCWLQDFTCNHAEFRVQPTVLSQLR
jgi:hypothetical protein